MTVTSRFSAWIAIALVAFTNFLFADKYFSRFSNWGLLVALAYTCAFTALTVGLPKTASQHWTRNRFLLLLGTVSAFWIVIFFLTDVTTLRVDRWYMIDTFLRNLFAEIYPYTPNPNSNIITKRTNVAIALTGMANPRRSAIRRSASCRVCFRR